MPLRARLWAAAGHIIKPKELKEHFKAFQSILEPLQVLESMLRAC